MTVRILSYRLVWNKCIGDDTNAAARQSLNCIKNKNIQYGEKQFSICRMEFLHPAMWLWYRDSEFTKWQHPAMWYVALGWHVIEFSQTSAILEFYIWFPFPHITTVDMSFCTNLRNFIQIGPPSAEKMTSCRISRWRISAILGYRDRIMGSFKSPYATSYMRLPIGRQ